MTIIKRYSNRKLYDTDARRYVTLEEVAGMIRQGEEVDVIDHLTGIDMTAVTMAQIVFEQEKKIGGYLPRIVLSRLIRSGSRSMRDLQNSLRAFIDPDQYFKEELHRRLFTLVEKEKISKEQGNWFVDQLLSLDIKNKINQNDSYQEENAASIEEFQALIDRVEQLEMELRSIVEA